MRVLLAILLTSATPGVAMKPNARDTKTAKASLLATKDLGKGWSAKPASQQGVGLNCAGFQPSGAGIVETGAAASPSFTFGSTGPFLFQRTSVYAMAAEANTYWQRAVKAKLVTCLVEALQQVEKQGINVTISKQGRLPFASILPDTAAFRVVGVLKSPTNKLTNYYDVIILHQGRTITALTISSFVRPSPAAFERGVAQVVAKKLGGGAA